MRNTKKLWQTKTFWVNALALIGLVIQSYTPYQLNAEAQISILAGVNILLRAVTKTEIVWE